MVFDRISLIAIYDVLQSINDNDGVVSNILMNKSSMYGTKSAPKIQSLQDLKNFIESKYPYLTWNPDCECAVCNESIYTLLGFTVHLKNSRHAIFVNNLRRGFESAKELQLNALSVKKCNDLFSTYNTLHDLKASYVCFPYINTNNGMPYTNPCEYIEILRNEKYTTLIDSYYKLTKRPDFPRMIQYKSTPCGS